MASQNLYENIEKAATLLATELEKTQNREKKLMNALMKSFPFDLYKVLTTNEKHDYQNEAQIIENYLEHGINTINLKEELKNRANSIALRNSVSCLRDTGILNFRDKDIEHDNTKRVLLKTIGNPSNLAKNKGHEFAINHSKIHYESNTVCTWIPKNGCSNIRYSIALANGAIEGLDEIKWIHDNNNCFIPTIKESICADFTFIILRNPFKRLLSFFLDKLCHSDEFQEEKSYAVARDTFSFESNMCFEDFINYIWENPNSIYSDEHTCPQCDFALYRNYDKYFSVEKFEEAISYIHQKINLDIVDVRKYNSIFTSQGNKISDSINHRTSAIDIKRMHAQKYSPLPENMYTDQLIRKVVAIYLQDIILYSNHAPGGGSELHYWIKRIF